MALREAVLVLVLLPGSLACERTDTDRSTGLRASAPATPARATAPEQTASRPVATCVVPLSSTPPPEALPAADCPPDPGASPALPRGRVRFPDAAGKPSVDVELARTDSHRQRGLMYRRSMGSDEGMLFSWANESHRSFWMRNTCIPLDLLFIAADGTIAGILEQVPTLDESPRRVPCPSAHVLEVNAGWSRAHGVEPGQRVEIDT
jgi:uncharacterized protein